MILTDPADPPSALPRGTRLGEFEIKRVLGAGGFGIVYLALDHALEREVAIKEYMPVSMAGRTAALHVSLLSQSHAESFAVGLRSFVNEARLLARFDHPSLVKVLRYWEQHNTAYMAMPFYAGNSLQRTRRHLVGPPAEAYVRSILEPLLGALEQLHREAVYHRDIAPDNIIVAPDGRPVLLDFGAARRVLADVSVALTAILKPAYAPIEQYGETGAVKQGPWTDLYALGATTRYLLLGYPPAPATTRTVVDELVPMAKQPLPGCSPAFLQCIDWMLQPRPADRPQSVAALREALDACRAAPPASLQSAAGRWQTTQLMDPAAGPAHEATMFDPSLAPSTLPVAAVPHQEATQLLPRDPLLDEATVLLPGVDQVTLRPDRPGGAAAAPEAAAPPAARPAPLAASQPAGGRTDPTLDPAAAEPTAAAALPPAMPARGAARRWPLVAAGLSAAALLGLALWLPGSRSPELAAKAPLPAAASTAPAATPLASALPSASAAESPVATPAPSPAPSPTTSVAPDTAVAAASAVTAAQAKAPARASAPGRVAIAQPAATPIVTAPAAGPSVAPGGRPGLATSITRLPLADTPAPAGAPATSPASPANAVNAANTGHANTPVAGAAPGPMATTAPPAAAVAQARPAAESPAAPPPAARPTAPPATRAAERDSDPVLVQARALSPSERCEGRVLVALWACVERQCKTDSSLRDHPECQKLRREQ